MKSSNVYIIKIEENYLTGFEGDGLQGKTSHMGWQSEETELGSIELSIHKIDAKKFDGNINLKSALDKIYDRLRFGNFHFERMEIISFQE